MTSLFISHGLFNHLVALISAYDKVQDELESECGADDFLTGIPVCAKEKVCTKI